MEAFRPVSSDPSRDLESHYGATASPRVADRGEVSQQVRRFGWLERLGVGELGQSGWDRG